MKTLKREEIEEMIRCHEAWLCGEPNGKRAEFRDCHIENYEFEHCGFCGVY